MSAWCRTALFVSRRCRCAHESFKQASRGAAAAAAPGDLFMVEQPDSSLHSVKGIFVKCIVRQSRLPRCLIKLRMQQPRALRPALVRPLCQQGVCT